MSVHRFSPAFPIAYTEENEFHKGMSLRDYFAAAAIHGLAERPLSEIVCNNIASTAYKLADAMLEVSGK